MIPPPQLLLAAGCNEAVSRAAEAHPDRRCRVGGFTCRSLRRTLPRAQGPCKRSSFAPKFPLPHRLLFGPAQRPTSQRFPFVADKPACRSKQAMLRGGGLSTAELPLCSAAHCRARLRASQLLALRSIAIPFLIYRHASHPLQVPYIQAKFVSYYKVTACGETACNAVRKSLSIS